MTIINGIHVHELPYDPKAPRQSYLVPDWADRYAVANGLLGLPGAEPGQHPTVKDAFVTRITIHGAGPARQVGGFLAYESALVTAEYSVPQFTP